MRKRIEWNGEVEYYHLTMVYDETNMYETVGQVDYIFIGTVDEVIDNVVDYNTSNSMDAYSRFILKKKVTSFILNCYNLHHILK